MRRRCAVYKYPGARRGAPWRSRSQAPSRVCRAACADAPGVLWRRCRAPLNVYCPLQQAYLRLWLGILSNAPPDSGAARLRPFVEQATCPTGRANRGAATRPCDFHVCARTHAQGTRQSRHTTLHSATCTHVVSQTCLFLALAQPARRQPTAQAAQRRFARSAPARPRIFARQLSWGQDNCQAGSSLSGASSPASTRPRGRRQHRWRPRVAMRGGSGPVAHSLLPVGEHDG